jgi:hypothetical protein
MSLICTSGPQAEPVSLSELHSMLRIDQTDTSQDDVLTSLNMAARTWCETILQRKIVKQQWQFSCDYFPGVLGSIISSRFTGPYVSGPTAMSFGLRYAFVLPFPPVQSIDLFTYTSVAGVVTPLVENVDYIADILSQPARLCPPVFSFWPTSTLIMPNAVQINFTLGYASPISVTTTAGDPVLGTAVLSPANVGQPISIPGAGSGRGCLNTIVASVDVDGVATLRDAPVSSLTQASTALIVDHGTPGHFELIKTAIKFLVSSWFTFRVPSFDKDQRDVIEAILGPALDLRL